MVISLPRDYDRTSGTPLGLLEATLTPANHVKAAKLVRRKAASSEYPERARCLQKSNTLLICAAMACRATGDSLDLSSFDRTAVCPDWSAIDAQIARLRLERVKAPSIVPSA
jgi:hypothetical protein